MTREQRVQPPDTDPAAEPRAFCWTCHRSRAACICEGLQPFATGPRFVILMHPKERRLRTGTGRMTHLLLRDSLLHEGVDFTDDPLINRLLVDPAYAPLLLYPGREAHLLGQSAGSPPGFDGARRPLIFVIDGTWCCAKKMLKLSENLHALPRLGCAPGTRSRFLFKRQPAANCLSTAEAIYHLLDALERELPGTVQPAGAHRALVDGLDQMVRFQIACANDSSRPGYRRRAHREHDGLSHAKRWERRRLLYETES